MHTNLTTHVQIVSDFLPLQVISLARHRFIFYIKGRASYQKSNLNSKNCNTLGELLIIFCLTERLFSSQQPAAEPARAEAVTPTQI